MKTSNFAGKGVLYSVTFMIFMFSIFTADTLGVSEVWCPEPCDHETFDACGEWVCIRCLDCSCNKCTEHGCESKCDTSKCEGCQFGEGPCWSICLGCKDYCAEDGNSCCNGTCYDPETKECCGGQVYDKDVCMKCESGEWVPKTQKCCDDTLWGSKYLCEINETCCNGQCCSENQACCNTSFTGGTCYNTTTQKCCPGVSGGYDFICDIDEICCDDGSCAETCVAWGSETLCSSEKNTSCPTCVGLLGHCVDSKAKDYTGEIIWNCSGGCPGDCDWEDPSPYCYDTYFCTDYIHYDHAECSIWRYPPGDIPQDPEPLECYSRDDVWGCTKCQQGSFEKHWPVASRTCK